MNDWERLHRQAERYKQSYPPGTRVMLLNMNDPYSPVESGMRGTVQSVDDIGQLLMKWDNGRALALIPGEDSFRRLTQEEIDRELQEQAQEQTMQPYQMVSNHLSPFRVSVKYLRKVRCSFYLSQFSVNIYFVHFGYPPTCSIQNKAKIIVIHARLNID